MNGKATFTILDDTARAEWELLLGKKIEIHGCWKHCIRSLRECAGKRGLPERHAGECGESEACVLGTGITATSKFIETG